MDTDELYSIAKCDLGDAFGGVFPADAIPDPTAASGFCFIANVDPARENGSHWVAFHKSDVDAVTEYFCSYGEPMPDIWNRRMPRGSYRDVVGSQLQSTGTSVCGQYCLYYLKQRVKLGRSTRQILRDFTKDTYANDRLVNAWLKSRHAVDLPIYDMNFIAQQIATRFFR